jgi:hypothetical protein
LSKAKKKDEIKVKPPQVENQVFNYILLFAFALFICFLTTFKISADDDVFWHLATGRYIIQNIHVPSTDVFGYISQGQKWIPFEWGWDVITFSVFNFGGFYSLSIFRTLIVLAIFSLFIIILRRNNINYSLIIIFSFVLIFGILTRLSIRPQLATYFFIVFLIYSLLNYNGNKSILYIIPAIFLVWANMHMGMILGMVLFAVFIVSEIIRDFFINRKSLDDDKKRSLKYLLYSFLFSLAAILINPNFISTYYYTFRHSQMDMLEQINEWKSPLRAAAIAGYNVKIYLFFLITGIAIIYYSVKKKNYFPLLIYVSVGFYSLQAIRFITDFMLSAFAFWMIAVNFVISKYKINKHLNKIAVKIVLTVFLTFAIINIADNSLYIKYLGNYFRESGFGVNEKFFPKAMFDFIQKEEINKIGEKPFNNLKIGGYFIWNFPESKNFIDSRNLNDSIYTLYKNIDLKKPGFENLIDKLEIDYVMYSTPSLTVNATEIERNIVSYLSTNNDKWKLIYWDDRSFLFVRNIPKFNNVISKFEYKYLSPYQFIFQRDLFNKKYLSDKVSANAELKKKYNEEPKGIIINDMAENFKRVN